MAACIHVWWLFTFMSDELFPFMCVSTEECELPALWVWTEYIYTHAFFKSRTNYLYVLCILSYMQQNSYKDQLCTRSLWVCVSKDELITLQTAKQTAHCTSCLFSCMFVTKRQLLSALLYMPLALLSIEIEGNKRDFKSIPCHLATLFGDTYYNNLSRRLSLVGHMNIKFWHTKINESS